MFICINTHMNYQKIYDSIIDRGKNRTLDGYKETHHIIPRCLGGTNEKDNLVDLTPEEHYVCHQLLVKIYPNESGLVFAANMMCSNSKHQQRGNKLYGWLRRRYVSECRRRVGEKNPSYGTMWITNGSENKKILKDSNVPEGWYLGRFVKSNSKIKVCRRCGCHTCKRPDVCNKKWIINSLVFFGFDRGCLGSLRFYDEYDRIKALINDEYHINMLSTLKIVDKYNFTSTQRLDHVFKILNINKRSR